jgi:hypothetical protein
MCDVKPHGRMQSADFSLAGSKVEVAMDTVRARSSVETAGPVAQITESN